MATKKEIRQSTKIFKSEVEQSMIDFAGDIICYRVMALEEYKCADTLFIYADYNKEVKTKTLIEDALKAGKKVALPRIYDNVLANNEQAKKIMKFHFITSFDDLETGYMGIREPKAELPIADGDSKDAIIIMPLVGFDENRNRVGYGGGFYDRYLDIHDFKVKIGVAYEEQKADEVSDCDANDKRPDMIITQKSIY